MKSGRDERTSLFERDRMTIRSGERGRKSLFNSALSVVFELDDVGVLRWAVDGGQSRESEVKDAILELLDMLRQDGGHFMADYLGLCGVVACRVVTTGSASECWEYSELISHTSLSADAVALSLAGDITLGSGDGTALTVLDGQGLERGSLQEGGHLIRNGLREQRDASVSGLDDVQQFAFESAGLVGVHGDGEEGVLSWRLRTELVVDGARESQDEHAVRRDLDHEHLVCE